MLFRKIVKTFGDMMTSHLQTEYEATDFGRRYGWWVCLREQRVADLNYLRWDSHGQFWHDYRLFAFHPAFEEIGIDPERWCQPDVSLESRYVSGFRVSGILMSPRGGDIVSIRFAYIPKDLFMRAAREALPDQTNP